MLDVQAVLDRGSEPMIPATWLQSKLPANINDQDMWFGYEGHLQDSEGFTDMTFTMMTCSAQYIFRLLSFAPAAETGATGWNARQCHVETFRERAAALFQYCEPDTIPFHWYARQVTKCISAILQLVALRPLRLQPNSSAPRVKPGSLLKLAVEVLQIAQDIIRDPRAHSWYWFDRVFVKWHALAVAINEICVCEDLALIEKYWPPVELAFDHLGFLVADFRHGTVWTPVEKLMRKAREKLRASRLKSRVAPDQLSNTNATLLATNASTTVQSIPELLTPNESPSIHVAMASMASTSSKQQPENTDTWPDIWEGIDVIGNSLDPFSEIAWADWENFVDDFNVTEEAMNIFPSHRYSDLGG
jgi:hypothetical protein